MQKEIDALIYAENRRRDRRNARFWFGALIIGIVAAVVLAMVDARPLVKALLALVAFVGIFGFLAFISTRKSMRGWFGDVFDWS